MATTAERLSYALGLRHMKAVELHEKTGIGKSSISQYLSGVVKPKQDRIYLMAQVLDVNELWLMGHDVPMERRSCATNNKMSGLSRIPILGRVVAGVPIEAIEEVLGYVDLDNRLLKRGEYFALQVKGDSMTPTLHDGDTIIVRKQEDINSGELGIVLVNGDEATVKEVKKSEAGITLIGHNASVYPPHFYSREEVESLPVQIIGKVVKMERWF